MSDVTDEAKQALEGVTAGPWAVMEKGFGKSDNGPTVYAADDELRYIAKVQDTFNVTPTPNTNNARFIAWAREGVPALLAEIAAKDADIARLRMAIAQIADQTEGVTPDPENLQMAIGSINVFALAALKGDSHE